MFIKVTDINKKEIYINVNKIDNIEFDTNIIIQTDRDTFFILESLYELKDRINKIYNSDKII